MAVEHGGTDAGPSPRVDASSNANPYGPSPAALAALEADLGPYPDPSATATRQALAAHHDCDPDEVVVGVGATELIDRLVRVVGGPVLTEHVTFGEYAGAAARHGLPHRGVPRRDLATGAQRATLAFVCSPGNPDGEVRGTGWCDEVALAAAASQTVLVWDLAYAPMVQEPVPVPDGAVALHAPNKAHGCTGLRAGWLRAPVDLAARLRDAAVTWGVSTPGLAFLRATATSTADAWVAERRRQLRADRDALAAALRDLDLEVAHGAAPFVLARVPDDWTSRGLATTLREAHGIKVRPTDSMGRPGWLRIAALPAAERDLLVTAFDRVLHQPRQPSSEPITAPGVVAGSADEGGARSTT